MTDQKDNIKKEIQELVRLIEENTGEFRGGQRSDEMSIKDCMAETGCTEAVCRKKLEGMVEKGLFTKRLAYSGKSGRLAVYCKIEK